MSYNSEHKTLLQHLKSLATKLKSKLDAQSSSSANLNFPPSDGNVYVYKNGAWVKAYLVNHPTEWEPAIDDNQNIAITADTQVSFQLTGTNAQVNFIPS